MSSSLQRAMRYSFYISPEEGRTLKEVILAQWGKMKGFAAATRIHPTILSRIVGGKLCINPNQAATMYNLLKKDEVKFLQEYQTNPPNERMHKRKRERYWHEEKDPLYQQYRKFENIYRSSPASTQQQMIEDLEQLANKYFSAMVGGRRK